MFLQEFCLSTRQLVWPMSILCANERPYRSHCEVTSSFWTCSSFYLLTYLLTFLTIW